MDATRQKGLRLAGVLLALALAGCATPEQLAAQREAQIEYQRQQEIAYTMRLRQQCEAIGYRQDTDQWRECILRLHQQAQAQNAALRNVLIQQYLSNQPRQTTCGRDYAGRVVCQSQ